MSEKTPPPDDPIKGAKPKGTDDAVDEFMVQIGDGLEEKEFQEQINTLIKQNAEQMKIITEMNTREQLSIRDKLINSKLDELENIKPSLREKFKDEKDIGRLEDAIKLAKEMNIDQDDAFPELGGADPDDKTAPKLNMMDPILRDGTREII